jgi:hypothetical protein
MNSCTTGESIREKLDHGVAVVAVPGACRFESLPRHDPNVLSLQLTFSLTLSSTAFSKQQREVSSWTQGQESKAPSR